MENHEIISSKLDGISQIHQFESSAGDFQSSYYCKSMVLRAGLEKKRVEIIEALTTRGVGTSIYYPRPVPGLPYYREKYGHTNGQFPEATKIAHHSIALPVGPHLQSDDAEYVADTVIEVVKKLL